MGDPKPAFDPRDHLTKVKGADYLPVSARISWFRDDSPNGTIDCEHVILDPDWAVFKAVVTRIGDGGEMLGRGSGYGAVTHRDFPSGHIEKASTKAIGRALASLGYGTEDVGDDEGDGTGGVVDSPIDFATTRGRRAADAPPRSGGPVQPATPKQITFIQALAREVGLSDDQLNHEAARLGGAPLGELTRRDASALVEWLQARRDMADLTDAMNPSASAPPASKPPAEAARPANDLWRLHGFGKARQLEHADIHALAFLWYGRRSVKELPPPELAGLIAALDPKDAAGLSDERLATDLVKAYAAIEQAKTAPPADKEPKSEPAALADWDAFWRWVKAAGLPHPANKLVTWLGEEIKHLTPQQAKELVELRRRERAELEQGAEQG